MLSSSLANAESAPNSCHLMIKKILPLHEVNFPVTLAPMVGLSHVVLREIVHSYMPEEAQTIWPTEMLSSRRLIAQKVGATPETIKHDEDELLVPQILGNEERFIAGASERLEDWGARGIDINMGCPVKKALRHNYGVALMGDPDYAAEVVSMAVRNTNLPVSVKFRAGSQNDPKVLLNFAQKIEGAGAAWVTLHPRTAEQKRKGKADWSQIKLLKKELSIPVIGNGDIQEADDILRMLGETNCDQVMVGRALTVRPWLMWQVGESLGFKNPKGLSTSAPRDGESEAYEYGKVVLKFLNLSFKYFEKEAALKRFRFFLRVSHPWLNFGHQLVKIAHKHAELETLNESISEFFSKPGLFLSEHTELSY